MHVKEEFITASVQYKMGNKSYFKISETDYLSTLNHINSCEECKKIWKRELELYQVLAQDNKKHIFTIKRTFLMAATVVTAIFFSNLYFTKDRSELKSINLNDFNLKIYRSSSENADAFRNKMIAELNRGNYQTVIDSSKTKNLGVDNLPLVAAYILLGQEKNDTMLYNLGINQLDKEKFSALFVKLKSKKGNRK
jgi:hypothetical protein